MVDVFKEQVIRTTEERLNITLEKLKKDKLLQRKIRELADISLTLRRYGVILKEISRLDKDSKENWKKEREELEFKRNKMYSELEKNGLEQWWISTIISFEMEEIKKLTNNARENAYKNHFGEVTIRDFDIMDERWELVLQEIEKAKAIYFEDGGL
jgi:HD superfamily phosphohydrolase